ncbi:MAG: hypothetical protein ACPGO7_05745, partial [Alphaproteobacteria bacterium]
MNSRRRIFGLRYFRLQNTPALREPKALEACWIRWVSVSHSEFSRTDSLSDHLHGTLAHPHFG